MGLVIIGLLASGLGSPLPGFIRFGAAFAALVWIPGVVLVRDVVRVRPDPVLLRYPLYLFAGMSAASLVTWPFVFAGASFSLYRPVLLWGTAVFLAGGVWIAWRRSEGARPGARALPAIVALVVLGSLAALQPSMPGVEQDAFDHIGYVRHVLTENRLAPDGVLVVPDEAGALPHDPRKGAWHGVLALISSVTGLDPSTVWRYQPVMLFPFAFFAFLAFCRRFTKGTGALAACAVLFALSYGGVGLQYPETVAYGQNLAVAWYWVMVPMLLAGEARGVRGMAVLALVAAGGVVVHVGVALHAVILAVTVIAFAPWVDRGADLRRRAAVIAGTAVVAALWKLAWAHGSPNALHAHEQGVLTIGRWFVVSPMEVLRQHGMLFLGGLALIPLLVFMARRGDARRLLAFSAIPVVACFVPFVTTPLMREGSYMVSRSLLNIPVFPIIVVVVAGMVQGARARGVPARVGATVLLTAWALVFVAPTVRAVSRELASGTGHPATVVDDALAAYVRRLPVESVILSDPRTAYALSAQTPHRYVAVHGQHANPLDPFALDRLQAVRDVLSPYAPSPRAVAACARYHVDFVVCNASSRARPGGYFDVWDGGDYAVSVSRLDAVSGSFRLVHQGSDFSVFLYDPAGTGQSTWGPPGAPYSETTSADLVACRIGAPDGAFAITAVSASPDPIIPGETLRVTIGYEKSNSVAFGPPYEIHVRLDHESITEGADYPGAKHVRRFEERRHGWTRRLTVTHRPLAGRLDVDLWPIGRRFYETVPVPLPPTLEPGTYTLRFTIERVSLLPNFAMSDLLFNHDRLDGTACLPVEVVRKRVGSP